MEYMFLYPGLQGSLPLTKAVESVKRHQDKDTHDTSSCGSEERAAAKHPQQASIASAASHDSQELRSSPPSSPLSQHNAMATVATPTIVKPAFATMDQATADELVKKSEQRVKQTLHKSSDMFQPEHSLDQVPTFTMEDDITRGDLLGSGGFASVYSVSLKDPSRLRDYSPHQQYVVKYLAPKLLLSPSNKKNHRKLFMGAKDLVMEATILSALNHKHVLKVHGVSRGGLRAYAETLRTDAYFMILPQLSCTLNDKISIWKKQRIQEIAADAQRPKTSGPWWRPRKMSPENKQLQREQQDRDNQFLCERLHVVIDLCQALEYLHEHRIMHRDIKPPNIGFDQDGCLKVFDFGLAKEIPPGSTMYNQEANAARKHPTFRDLGNTGTTRYMAPEVIRREPYNCKVDVFAASIICWELTTLKKPYGIDVSGQFVKECVAIYDDRPTIPSPSAYSRKRHHTVWPKALKKLVQQGWTKDVGARLSAEQMRKGLEEIVDKREQQQLQQETSPSIKRSDSHNTSTKEQSASC